MTERPFHVGWLQPYLAAPFALGLFWWMADRGLVASSYWLLASIVAVGAGVNAVLLVATRNSSVRRRVHLRAFAAAAQTAAVVYAMGWGPMLIVAFGLGVAEVVRADDGVDWGLAVVWMIVAVTIGELLVALGIAPSMMGRNLSHVVALGGVICTVILLRMFATTTRAAREARAELAENEQRFRRLVQHANDVIAVLDADCCVDYVSPAVHSLLGRRPEDCVGRGIDELQHDPARHARFVMFAEQLRAQRPGVPFHAETELRHADGTARIVEVTMTALVDGTLIANLHDVTERRVLEAALRTQALTDTLTGLRNRAAITASLDAALARMPTAILYVDLDGFKQVNDQLGHEEGDRLLVAAAERLTGALGDQGVVGRLGGDEFLVVMPGVGPDDAIDVADRIVSDFGTGWTELPMPITASVGLALSRSDEPLDALIRRSDEAMYLAKERGRARYCLAG